MRILKRALLALVAIIVLLSAIGFLLPAQCRVERTVTVRAKSEDVFSYLQTLKKWPEWTAWNLQRYPDMKTTFSGPEAGVGATYNWEGKDVGVGSIKITNADPNKGVTYDLEFDQGTFLAKGEIKMEPSGDNVKLTWANESELGWNPVNRYFGLLMDRFMGPDLEAGLNSLKQKLESQ
jgi:hypothetical protein